MVKLVRHPDFDNVYWATFEGKGRKLVTKSFAPGFKVFVDEWVFEHRGEEFRVWDPYRSKLAAAILKGVRRLPIRRGDKVLYLGAASGTTASFISDIVDREGAVFCVEISSRPLRDLLQVCDRRPNMVPVLADARDPCLYACVVPVVDLVYQDVAQPDQVEIFIRNMRVFLRDGGYGVLALKARAIDVSKKPCEIFSEELEELQREFDVLDTKILDPYERDHAVFVVRKQG
jgi:fibrillarin-like pre-rRNA processing protein